MTFTKDIKHALIEKDMNPSDLARQSGYSPQHINNLLKGEKRWNVDSMQKVCEVLGLELRVVPKEGKGDKSNGSN
ncbi:helix-turn-helix domain-containing protein [Paenibacillus sp. NRS-1782]|uniref:helix-turn-helix domain-containing protein n=1 Tax=unclassified Paenibacillus TaxID=185978 RepID=UPI003D2B9B62